MKHKTELNTQVKDSFYWQQDTLNKTILDSFCCIQEIHLRVLQEKMEHVLFFPIHSEAYWAQKNAFFRYMYF